jgi:hypothetical protein
MFRFASSATLIAALILTAGAASAAPTTVKVVPGAALLVFELPVNPNAPATQVASNWTFLGCWTPRSGTPCSDVFRDPQGRLWICKACGTTGNPNPGKCRRTTQEELNSGLWCS